MFPEKEVRMGSGKKGFTGEDGADSRNTVMTEDDWRAACKKSVTNVNELSQEISLKPSEKAGLAQVIKAFHMRITPYFLSLIQDAAGAADPIRKQCVPSIEEIRGGVHESIDPLAEEKTSPFPCLVHRYPDRVLLLVTGKCFMYCRHCTRKRLWKHKTPEPTLKDIEEALDYVKEHKEIREVVISGGDPLTLPTEHLDQILAKVSALKNVEAIRIGTRTPVVLPSRIDDQLCEVLEKYDNIWMNVQFNHPREITPQAAEACRRIQRCGIPVNNQSVLLKGINDDPEIMTELCQKLQSIRVRPYYLFQCDPVVGAYHFITSIWKGVELIEKMRGHTGGMCVPNYVVDGIEGKGKIPLGPNYLISMSSEGVTLRNYQNETFFYPNSQE
jgi:lysine 2,3-aminomutase